MSTDSVFEILVTILLLSPHRCRLNGFLSTPLCYATRLFSSVSHVTVICIRVLQRDKANRKFIWILAHVIMEAEKSPYMLSASWSLRKADGTIQLEFEGLRTRGADGVVPSLGLNRLELGTVICEGKRRWMSQPKKTEKEFVLPLPFHSF